MKKILGLGLLGLLSIAAGCFLVWSMYLGLGMGWDSIVGWTKQTLQDFETAHTNVRFIEKIRIVEKEPDYGDGDGLEGKIRKSARKHRVPVAIAFSVGLQEGSLSVQNMQINCPPKFAAKKDRYRWCAFGLFQLIPVFNDIDDPRTIWGPENLDKSIDLGMARLRHDYDVSKGKTERDRWYNALILYYGAEQDDYQKQVLARAVEMALKYG